MKWGRDFETTEIGISENCGETIGQSEKSGKGRSSDLLKVDAGVGFEPHDLRVMSPMS